MIGKKVHRAISGFIDDLLDRSATTKKYQFRLPDIWGTTLIVLSGGASFVDVIRKVDLFGVPGTIFPIVLLLFGLAWCVHVIVVKVEERAESTLILPEQDPKLKRFYSYGQPVRYLAKAGLPLLLLLIPKSFTPLFDEIRLLPTTFSGQLINASDGTPIADATVRVLTEDGVDVTKGIWLSDSEGFYIVDTVKRVNSQAQLVVRWPDCASEKKFTFTTH